MTAHPDLAARIAEAYYPDDHKFRYYRGRDAREDLAIEIRRHVAPLEEALRGLETQYEKSVTDWVAECCRLTDENDLLRAVEAAVIEARPILVSAQASIIDSQKLAHPMEISAVMVNGAKLIGTAKTTLVLPLLALDEFRKGQG